MRLRELSRQCLSGGADWGDAPGLLWRRARSLVAEAGRRLSVVCGWWAGYATRVPAQARRGLRTEPPRRAGGYTHAGLRRLGG